MSMFAVMLSIASCRAADGGAPLTDEPAPAAGVPELGVGADMHGYRPFPDDNPWNKSIDTEPIDPSSAVLISAIGADRTLHPDFGADWDGGPFGIPYMVVSGTQARVPTSFYYSDESDKGSYPLPP